MLEIMKPVYCEETPRVKPLDKWNLYGVAKTKAVVNTSDFSLKATFSDVN